VFIGGFILISDLLISPGKSDSSRKTK